MSEKQQPNPAVCSPRLRVTIVHYGEASPVDNGYREQRYGQLARELHRRGHDVVRVLPQYPHLGSIRRNPSRLLTEHEGVVVHLETPRYSKARSLRRLYFLRRFSRLAGEHLAVERPDVVVAGFPPSLGRRVRASSPTSTVLVDVRDIWPDAQFGSIQVPVVRRVLSATAPMFHRRFRKPLGVADGLVANSIEYLRWANTIAPLTASLPCIVVPIGATPVAHDQPDTADHPTAVFVGSLNSHFDFEALLRAWACLISLWRDTTAPKLVIVGDGPAHELLRALSKDVPSISVLGWRPSQEASQIVAHSRVGIAPYASTSAMTSTNKVAEYLSAGIPVVTTKRTALSTELEMLGALSHADSSDTESYARAIIARLVEPRDLARECALTTFRAHFEASSVASRFAEFVEDTDLARRATALGGASR